MRVLANIARAGSVIDVGMGISIHSARTVIAPLAEPADFDAQYAGLREFVPLQGAGSSCVSRRSRSVLQGGRVAPRHTAPVEAWDEPLAKWHARVARIVARRMAISLGAHFYHATALSVLGFVLQLGSPPLDLRRREKKRLASALRILCGALCHGLHCRRLQGGPRTRGRPRLGLARDPAFAPRAVGGGSSERVAGMGSAQVQAATHAVATWPAPGTTLQASVRPVLRPQFSRWAQPFRGRFAHV